MSDIIAYAYRVINAETDACFEQCALVCLSLSKYLSLSDFHVVRLQKPGDHAFVVIGQQPADDGFFPDNFAHWHPEAVIVDVWAQLTVKARHYPPVWMMQTAVMAASHVDVPTPDGYQWCQPSAPHWQCMPISHRKYSFTAPNAPQCDRPPNEKQRTLAVNQPRASRMSEAPF